MKNNKMKLASIVFTVWIFTISLCGASTLPEIAAALVKNAGSSSVVKGTEGWLFLKEELVHIGLGKFWGDTSATDPVEVILAYNTLLAEKGITLYLMPVPPKAMVYADRLDSGVDRDVSTEQIAMYENFYDLLQEGGVKVIDLLPALMARREESPVYCKTDTHFSAEGIELFSEAAATVIKQADWYNGVAKKKEYLNSVRTITIHGDLAQMAGLNDLQESLDLSFVKVKESGLSEVSDPGSPVILLGDSHTLVFNAGGDLHAKGAGLFDHLSASLGFPVDLLGVRGSGVTPARIKLYQRSKKDSGYLVGKKAVIWCFAGRDFSGVGSWKKIPLAP